MFALEISQKIRAGELTCESVFKKVVEGIKQKDGEIKSFITLNEDGLQKAKNLDKKLQEGQLKEARLLGVPVGIKDMLCTKGLKTTAGSKILESFIPPYSSTVVDRLEEQGAIIVGKTNCDEFAMGSSNETSYFGKVKNPWNLDYVPGGSSGGSAAAVAARFVPASIGTDTGGSIRQPSHFCGVVGVRPTYGRVSRYGIVAFASSLDQAGPMAQSIEDAALILESISGEDSKDDTTLKIPVPKWSQNINTEIKGMKVGLVKEMMTQGTDKEVLDAVEKCKALFKQKGAELVEVSLPRMEYSVSTYYLISSSEASSNLARYDGVRYGYRSSNAKSLEDLYLESRSQGFGEEVKRRIMLGTFSLSSGYYDAYYQKACKVRRLIQEDYLKVFKECDILLGPVTTTPAFKIGERISDPLAMYMNDIYTTSVNLAGVPGISVPCQLSEKGLPIGVQLIAPSLQEQTLFNFGKVIEDEFQFKAGAPHGI